MRVVGLFHYPVKSMRGVALEEMKLGVRGPLHDREFMVVDAAGRFVSQRNAPRLATLSASVAQGALRLADDAEHTVASSLQPEGPARAVTIWRDTVRAVDCGDEVAQWLEARLGLACRLVHLPPSSLRAVDPAFRSRPDAQTGFSDGYPLLLTGTASLDDLNRRLAQPIGMARFRPNVVVATDQPWLEDGWRAVRVGEVELDLVKPCARCVIITTDQRSGEKPDGSAPLTALAAYRTQAPFGAIFGQNAIHRAPGRIVLGTAVEVLA
jgi:uncharacterized protein YcbX